MVTKNGKVDSNEENVPITRTEGTTGPPKPEEDIKHFEKRIALAWGWCGVDDAADLRQGRQRIRATTKECAMADSVQADNRAYKSGRDDVVNSS